MILAHSITLDPTPRQATYFARAAGTARFAWNNALVMWNRAYEADGKVDSGRLRREFNAMRREEFPWMDKVSNYAYAYPWIQLRKAFSAFFRKQTGHPKFRTKRRSPESFYVCHREMEFDGRTLHLGPKRLGLGPVRMREELRLVGKVMGATIRKDVDRWVVSVQVEVGDDYRKDRVADGVVGVDLGVTTLAALSTGEMIEGLRPLAKALDMLRRLSRGLSRKKKGSKNWEKSRLRLAKLHRRVRNVRRDFLHRLTTRLCRENQAVAIEDLSVRGMMRSRGLARLIADMGWGEFRRQLEYKCPIYGTWLKVADRFFPSSKTCSRCGAVRDELPRGERTFRCGCGLELDRDLNAALNLLYLLLDQGCVSDPQGLKHSPRSLVPANSGELSCLLSVHSHSTLRRFLLRRGVVSPRCARPELGSSRRSLVDELDALHKQLKEIVEDGDFISPDRAKELFGLLEAAMSGGLPESELDGDGESLHPSEEVAHEVFTLCDASAPYVAQAFPLFLRHLEPGIVRRLRDAVREASDIVDWVRMKSGPGVAPDLVLLLPAPTRGVVYWVRLRQVSQALEGVEARNG